MKEEEGQPRDGTVADGGTSPAEKAGGDVSEAERMVEPIPKETELEANREFLIEVVRRAPLLRVLRSGSADAGDLSKSTDMSRSTIHRAINSLQDHDIVQESDGEYGLTSFGEIIAEKTEIFGARACTAMALKQFLNSADMNGTGIPLERFTDVGITRRRSRHPHATIHRITELIEQADELRMFSTVISPVYVDVGYREMMNGMEIEAIFDREVVEFMLSEYPEKARETIETGKFDVYAHEGLPFELFLFGDRIGMAAHNENGNAEVLIECEDQSAIKWAEDLYSEHLSKAEPLTMGER